ncbi:hypothetical protein GCWU000342_00995 [Shuttleworthella satelles DSM 14600]|uniref:Uncharacterized protein n=1 Tax=Shuttleworthella satelles DSM 14600 TaxID=626523 RepID=C4GAP5_9FIRM|nr:hypothetical protein GCWU000342_00995 [Shuttleworthia satelles DSM 14600]
MSVILNFYSHLSFVCANPSSTQSRSTGTRCVSVEALHFLFPG